MIKTTIVDFDIWLSPYVMCAMVLKLKFIRQLAIKNLNLIEY